MLLLLAYFFTLLVSAYTPLSDSSLGFLPYPDPSEFNIHTGSILGPILQVRVPGTQGIVSVREHFINFFRSQLPDWTLSYQNSTQQTALGGDPITFVNIIATRDPPWASPGEVGRLALVAHYDSKISPKGFIGAIDSAAPCAMILHAAKAVDGALTKKWEDMQARGETDSMEGEKGVQILLLDGEEAFVSWTDTDSIYGARSLAEEWESTPHPAMSTYRTPLDSIDLFMLLDLLGSATPRIPSYFKTTHWAYLHLANLETRFRALKLFQATQGPNWFSDAKKDPNTGSFMGGLIGDDHLPFMARGVEILHLIPSPFPSVWHKMSDDGEHLHMETVGDWAVLVAAFVAEWMDLEGFLEVRPGMTQVLDRRKEGDRILEENRSEL